MLLLSTSEVDMEARDNMGRDLGTMIRYKLGQCQATLLFCYSAERVGECHRRRSWRWKT